jgi:hypothetical protein
MKAHIFELACPLYQEGAITPIFEGDMPPPKKTPKSGANIGPIAGVLLSLNLTPIEGGGSLNSMSFDFADSP